MKPLSQFEAEYYGKHVPNNHGGFVGECVSLAARWAQEGQGVADGDRALYCAYTGGARDLYESYGKSGMHIQEFYDKVSNPQEGDLAVWGANMGNYGDAAIYIGSGQVFGQLGTPVFIPAAARQLTPSPLGYLRRRGTMIITTEDVVALSLGTQGTQPQNADQTKWIGKSDQASLDGMITQYSALGQARQAALEQQIADLQAATHVKLYSGPQLFIKE